MRPYPSLTDLVVPSAPNYQPVPVNSSEDQWKRRPMNGFGKRLPEKRLRAKSVTYVSGTDREKMVGERGFEPPTPWSRTRCSTRLSHSPTEVSPFILLHVTSNVLCSENPENWDHWDQLLREQSLNPRHSLTKRVVEVRVSGRGFQVRVSYLLQLDLLASRWLGAWRLGRDEMHASLPAATREI